MERENAIRLKFVARLETLLWKLGVFTVDLTFTFLCPIKDMIVIRPDQATLDGKLLAVNARPKNPCIVLNPAWEKLAREWAHRKKFQIVKYKFKVPEDRHAPKEK